MLAKWFIIFCALLGAWFVLPLMIPALHNICIVIGGHHIKYIHIVCFLIFACGWKLESK